MSIYTGGFYSASKYGDKEVELMRKFFLQMYDARDYFLGVIKPRLDRSYKLYIAYNGDRAREIKRWQANIFVPYIQAVVETLMPRILDARPDFNVLGRTEEDQVKAEKQQMLLDYLWERAGMDSTSEDFVRAALVYGTSFLQVSWKKDVRQQKFLKTKDVNNRKYKWEEEERTFYDAPYCEWVDNYSLWYDWHNTARKSKQYWFKRMVLTRDEIERRYPMADPKRLEMAFNSPGGDLVDYAAVRQTVRSVHTQVVKGADNSGSLGNTQIYGTDKYYSTQDNTLQMYEVFEWTRPFEDAYSVHVGGSYVPILKGGVMPIVYDYKEAPFIETTYLKIPGEFEGYGIPLILESPQLMLNLIKNQRLDAATMSIHKMWVVNPLANITKDELVTRPFGIIYSIDPNGVKEIQFSDLKASAYKEEEMLKGDMRYSSGVDDFSMGVGGGAESATAVRHLRESTLERVRLFVNHLGDAYSDMLRYWMDMSRQFYTKEMTIRIIGESGKEEFPLIEKDDLMGYFDYKALVLPSIAGQNDIKKKQDMDLFQLLFQLPFVDQQKLVGKVIQTFGWTLDSITKSDQTEMDPNAMPQDPAMAGMEGMPGAMPPDMAAAGGIPMDPSQMPPPQGGGVPFTPAAINPDVLRQALATLRTPDELSAIPSPFAQASSPVNLLQAKGPPPTPAGVPKGGKTTNPRGLNRGGKVNTNIATKANANPESSLMNRTFNLQS